MSVSKPSRSIVITLTALWTLGQWLFAWFSAFLLLLLVMGGGLPDTQTAPDSPAAQLFAQGPTAAIFQLGYLIVIGAVNLAIAAALFRRRRWSWKATLAYYGLDLMLGTIQLLTMNPLSVGRAVNLAVSGLIVFLFLTNAEVKRQLGR